ncbi:hypothetical protein TrVE_jg8205 [Triparma verrucosa]|uniref:Uncharacterized protein n=1 Tax=Triparma verrucosa TaxID=1606542 RepID=A0A9W7CFW4_9STRA|nr:hypothetical protein TrVE_jg8205 [Triparma verrucosa]
MAAPTPFNPGFDPSIPPRRTAAPPSQHEASSSAPPSTPLLPKLNPPPPPPPPPVPEALHNLQATQDAFTVKFEEQRNRIMSAQMREYDNLMPSLRSLQHLMDVTTPDPDPGPSSSSPPPPTTSSPLQGRKLDLVLKSPIGPTYRSLHEKCGPLLKKLNAMVRDVESSPDDSVTVETQQELWRANWNFRTCLSQTACYAEHMQWQSCVKHCTAQKPKLNPKVYCKDFREMSKICGAKFTSEVFKASESDGAV